MGGAGWVSGLARNQRRFMPDDYYGGAGGAGASATEASDATPPETSDNAAPEEGAEDKEGMGEDTALLPKTFFGDKPLEPGTECKVKIEHVYDDEVEVSYVPHDQEEAAEGESNDNTAPAPNMAAAQEQLGGMMGT